MVQNVTFQPLRRSRATSPYTGAALSRSTESFKPYYGPGYNYATLPKAVSQNAQVPVFFTDNYWVMFDYTLPNGQIQRGWAPPECWTY